VPSTLKNGLEAALTRAKGALTQAKDQLSKVKSDTKTGKLVYTFFRAGKLRRKYSEFKRELDVLDQLCMQLDGLQTMPPSSFLRPDFFKLIHETMEHQPGETLPLSDIFVARGNYSSDAGRVTGLFVLEKKYRENDIQFLCNILTRRSLSEGILKCLGYRQPPYNEDEPPYRPFFQLVMELPDHPHKSLSYAISCDAMPPLGLRLQYAKQITSIVSHVHENGLVHKSIRPRTILLLEVSGEENNITQIYLQDWTYVRESSGASSFLGVGQHWNRQIYQHPEVQGRPGRYIETAYNDKHDLYGLGVTLLELFLWVPFVERVDKTDLNSPLKISQLFEGRALSLGEANGGAPSRYRGDTEKLTSYPSVIQNVWVDIATHELAAIHPGLSLIILECLRGEARTAGVVSKALSTIEVEE